MEHGALKDRSNPDLNGLEDKVFILVSAFVCNFQL